MMIAKRAIPRRAVLRGIGATLALPFLDAMVPALSAQVRAVHRFGVVYAPNGVIQKAWLPTSEGAAYELSPTLLPLAPLRDQMLVVSGLSCVSPPGRPGGFHAKAATRFLTDVTPPTSETWLDAGISLDQVLAAEFASKTQLASLELAIESNETAGTCDIGFACAYSNTISWKSANTPLSTQNNPRVVFERLFGDSGSTDARARLQRIQQDRSILDSITEETNRLRGTLGPSDRTKLGEYLEAVRDVERRLHLAEEQRDREVSAIVRPPGIPADYDQHVNLMFDLMLLAYQSDMTRVITFMLGREFSGMTYPQIGVPDAHHPISHHAGDRDKIDKMMKVNQYHASLFARLLERMRTTPDGDGSLLDHSTMMYGYGMAESDTHSQADIPLVLAGGGVGTLRGGRHIRFTDTPLANLHVTLIDNFGVRLNHIGDSTGRVSL